MSRSPRNDSTPSPGCANGSSTRSEGSTVAESGKHAARRVGLAVVVALVVVAIDQLTKWWAVDALGDGPIEVAWTLQLRLIRNFGGSFGTAQGHGDVISVIGLVVIGALLFAARKPRPRPAIVALGFFIGGAAGNIIDRVVREGTGFFGGGVVDFIDFGWWPVFNVADISLFVGVGLLLLVGLDDPDGAPDLELDPEHSGQPEHSERDE